MSVLVALQPMLLPPVLLPPVLMLVVVLAADDTRE
jgi:hypothetical protein